MRILLNRRRMGYFGIAALACLSSALLGCGGSSEKDVGAGDPAAGTSRAPGQVAPSGAASENNASAGAVVLTDSNFATKVEKGVVLVDFWSPQCPPCRTQGPIVDGLARKLAGRAIVGKLNVNQNPEKTGEFSIGSIPALLVFKDGKVVKRLIGLRSESELTTAIEEALGKETDD